MRRLVRLFVWEPGVGAFVSTVVAFAAVNHVDKALFAYKVPNV